MCTRACPCTSHHHPGAEQLVHTPHDYTRVYTYHTVGTVRMTFTPICTLFAHYLHSRRIVFTAIRTLFAHYSHTIRTVAHYSHGRTLLARSHNIHSIHTVFSPGLHYSQLVRAVHTLFAPLSHQKKFAHYSHQFSHPGHTKDV